MLLAESRLASIRSAAAHLDGQLILALAEVDDMPEQPVWCPFDIADLNDHFEILGAHDASFWA
jgi:hypothetical protein